MFKDKCVVVGITGSIAAYKAIDLVSKLKKKGADVHCVLTESAQSFNTTYFKNSFAKSGNYGVVCRASQVECRTYRLGRSRRFGHGRTGDS